MASGTEAAPAAYPVGNRCTSVALTFSVFLCLLPWMLHILETGLNGDTSWYIIAARRLLAGMSMAESYYENNPPLPVLFHVPAVWLADFLGLHPHYTLIAFMFLLTAGGAKLTVELLGCFPFMGLFQKTVIMSAYIAGATILPSISFGEREQMIFLALFPLSLTQLARTNGYAVPRRLFRITALAGAFSILLKPHYAVLPGLLQLHRAIKRRRLRALFDAEFFYCAGAAAAGILTVILFFPDYVSIILPDVLALYITTRMPETALPALISMGAMIAIFSGIEKTFSPLPRDQKNIMLAFYMMALVCLVPYAVQMKGFYYHLIPAMGFFFTGVCLTIASYVEPYIREFHPRRAAATLLLMVFAAAYAWKPLLPNPTVRDYRTLPLTTFLKRECGKDDCNVFMFNDSVEIVPPTMIYNGFEHATRFPAFWLLPSIERQAAGTDKDALRRKFQGMVGEDMTRFRPDLLVLAKGVHLKPGERFDFISYFSADPVFAGGMTHDDKQEDFILNRRPYFKGTALDKDDYMTYEIWTRRKK